MKREDLLGVIVLIGIIPLIFIQLCKAIASFVRHPSTRHMVNPPSGEMVGIEEYLNPSTPRGRAEQRVICRKFGINPEKRLT